MTPIIVHPAYVARMRLGQLISWAHEYGLQASNVWAQSGAQYLVLRPAMAVRS